MSTQSKKEFLQRVAEFQNKNLPLGERTVRKGFGTGKVIGLVKNSSGVLEVRYL